MGRGAAVDNIVVVADTHCGCELGLMPPKFTRTGGATVKQSKFQAWLWRRWLEFWTEFVPMATNGEPYVVVLNGDAIDGRHHGATTQITSNLAEQCGIAVGCFDPVLGGGKCVGVYAIAGTEVHTGLNDESVVGLMMHLGAKPDSIGRVVRPELWIRLGTKGHHRSLVHLAHHIGASGVTAYETTAVHRELVEAMQNSARWRVTPPDVVVRSHRHIPAETRMMTGNGYATAVVTAGWQGKTPHVYRLVGGRVAPPQFGGLVVRSGDKDTYTRSMVWALKRDRPE